MNYYHTTFLFENIKKCSFGALELHHLSYGVITFRICFSGNLCSETEVVVHRNTVIVKIVSCSTLFSDAGILAGCFDFVTSLLLYHYAHQLP